MNQYIEELTQHLKKLSEKDATDAISYYTDYLIDGNLVTYDECVKELGSPKRLALQIRADISINNQNSSTPQKLWELPSIVILALFTSPLLVPVIISLILVILGAVLAASLMVLFLVLVLILTFIVFLCTTVWSVTNITGHFFESIMVFGVALFSLGLSMVIYPLSKWLVKRLANWIQHVTIWTYKKCLRYGHAEGRLNNEEI
ncbi:hypothetical protein AKUH3B110M_01340 [Apilactobacillus kunkeei]|uniref:DUF1700 domain-containing protein n=1 Tax=Apilactobacillus kunkeei TaxID=148814 RepID=UPI00167D07B5|nr:DUF1700 domain-containing protein [Apilactobacillus kunkeei]MCK8634315.1 DUF1700 domain-containing protein [Apilactobacillus kunkeei]CAI2555415.1 hypothetical protein AKUG0802_01350 [Apilactobacillus kunkeei]CAI2555835.1 hypothetical protein AKUG0405_01360 [Apilactobacillus kunkeei]CAI2555887.1 hypothetical protein AKUG0101_01390 [Apilactobacillus kunkeei]CAI2555919.1 hypothetical protein AKUG0103_01360 [Apilactobacillus kunkeei]